MRFGRPIAVIDYRTIGRWILHKDGKAIIRQTFLASDARAHLDAKRFGTRFNHLTGLWKHIFSDIKHIRIEFGLTVRERHGFRRRRRFIEHGRIGNVHACQIHNHLLEVQQRFQTTL